MLWEETQARTGRTLNHTYIYRKALAYQEASARLTHALRICRCICRNDTRQTPSSEQHWCDNKQNPWGRVGVHRILYEKLELSRHQHQLCTHSITNVCFICSEDERSTCECVVGLMHCVTGKTLTGSTFPVRFFFPSPTHANFCSLFESD